MGANDFRARARGKTAREAFAAATDHAAWEHGHGGYTGTIAEKHEFVEFPLPPNIEPSRFVDWVMDDCERVEVEVPNATRADFSAGTVHVARGSGPTEKFYRVERRPVPTEHAALVARAKTLTDDKWGPAGCVRVPPKPDAKDQTPEFLFFGWASS